MCGKREKRAAVRRNIAAGRRGKIEKGAQVSARIKKADAVPIGHRACESNLIYATRSDALLWADAIRRVSRRGAISPRGEVVLLAWKGPI